MIDILVPVRSRPANVVPLLASIKAATTIPYRVVFLVHPEDADELYALFKAGATYVRSPEHGYAPKINLGVKLSKAEYVFLAADDLSFHPLWDVLAINEFQQTQKPVIGTNDLGNPSVIAGLHATHSLVHRSYFPRGTIDDSDKLLHEGYAHNWVDTEFVATAKKRDSFTFCAESVVEHLHPFWQKSADDPIYEMGRQGYRQDHRLFQKRRRLWR